MLAIIKIWIKKKVENFNLDIFIKIIENLKTVTLLEFYFKFNSDPYFFNKIYDSYSDP